MPSKGRTSKATAPAVVEDEWDEDEDATVEATEAEEIEDDENEGAIEVEEPEEDDEIARVLNRNARRNEKAYARWLAENGVEGLGVDEVHAVLALYRVWRNSADYEAYKDRVAYEAEHKDEAIATRKLEKLREQQAKLEAELAAIEAAKAENNATIAASGGSKVAKAAKAAAKDKAARPVAVVPDVDDDDDEDDDF